MGNRNHASYIPSLKWDNVEASSETWASGNTKTITNAAVRANSFIVIMWTVVPSGNIKIVCSNGSFVITSSDALTNVTFKYRIL